MAHGTETRRPVFPFLPKQPATQLSYGLPFFESCKNAVEELQAERILILVSSSLSKNTDNLDKLRSALGNRVVGTFTGIGNHTSLNDLFPIIRDVREKNVDCIITFGGSKLVDGAKIIALALANDANNVEALLPLHFRHGSGAPSHLKPAAIPLIFIPTTLSGSEYTRYGAGTEAVTNEKYMFGDDSLFARYIILDPAATMSTPLNVWITSGVRAIDHCVEGMCSNIPWEKANDIYSEGLRLIVPGLFTTLREPENEQARLNCMLGCNLSLAGLSMWIPIGASHGIGHQLGPLGVQHGHTSAVLNPAVMKYNKRANSGAQDKVKAVLWGEDVAADVLRKAGLKREESDLGDATRAVFDALAMPRCLTDVGVGRDKWDQLADNSLRDAACIDNPVPLKTPEQVKEILEMIAGG